MSSPASLKAFLRAEIGALNAQLETGGALQLGLAATARRLADAGLHGRHAAGLPQARRGERRGRSRRLGWAEPPRRPPLPSPHLPPSAQTLSGGYWQRGRRGVREMCSGTAAAGENARRNGLAGWWRGETGAGLSAPHLTAAALRRAADGLTCKGHLG